MMPFRDHVKLGILKRPLGRVILAPSVSFCLPPIHHCGFAFYRDDQAALRRYEFADRTDGDRVDVSINATAHPQNQIAKQISSFNWMSKRPIGFQIPWKLPIYELLTVSVVIKNPAYPRIVLLPRLNVVPP